jgi:hypothetical protein
MSEFLQNLRAKQNKRYDGNRRQYPNPQYQDRRNEKDNRKQQQVVASAVETLSASLAENLPMIKTILEGVFENQKKLAEAEDRRARAEERKAILMENIFEYAKQYFGGGLTLSGLEAMKIKTEAQGDLDISSNEAVVEPDSPIVTEYDEPSVPGREEVLAMIGDLREKGSTYDQIAKHLELEGIPTFSRKGQWRGQTVHRLYQKMTS